MSNQHTYTVAEDSPVLGTYLKHCTTVQLANLIFVYLYFLNKDCKIKFSEVRLQKMSTKLITKQNDWMVATS